MPGALLFSFYENITTNSPWRILMRKASGSGRDRCTEGALILNAFSLSHRIFAVDHNAVGIVYNPVTDCVCQDGVSSGYIKLRAKTVDAFLYLASAISRRFSPPFPSKGTTTTRQE